MKKMLQKLSPQQIQFMKLLQVPTVNLEQRIKEIEDEKTDVEFDLSELRNSLVRSMKSPRSPVQEGKTTSKSTYFGIVSFFHVCPFSIRFGT